MNKSFIVAGIIIFAIIYWLIGFVNVLHDDVDVSHGYNEKALATGEKSYGTVNSSGDEVLLLNKLSLQEKKRLWNTSSLKLEMLELFPHFIQMKDFVEVHIEDDATFKEELLSKIEDIEFKYVGGSLSGENAKSALSNF